MKLPNLKKSRNILVSQILDMDAVMHTIDENIKDMRDQTQKDISIIFAALVPGRKKIHCHVFGDMMAFHPPSIGFKIEGEQTNQKFSRDNGMKDKKTGSFREIPKRRAKVLSSGLFAKLGDSETYQKGRVTETVILPGHFMAQMRKVDGKNEEKMMETVLHK